MNDVDEFIEKLKRTDEIAIHSKASEIMVKQSDGFDVSIAEGLARAIHDYQTKAPYENSLQYHQCRGWITIAYTHQMVLAGNKVQQVMKECVVKIGDLEQKLQLLQIEYDELLKTYQKTTDDNIAWQSKLEQLREDYDKLLKILTQEGSVTQD